MLFYYYFPRGEIEEKSYGKCMTLEGLGNLAVSCSMETQGKRGKKENRNTVEKGWCKFVVDFMKRWLEISLLAFTCSI